VNGTCAAVPTNDKTGLTRNQILQSKTDNRVAWEETLRQLFDKEMWRERERD
jgi:hypothetical protein